ncbi:major facilitator superfamily transporter [Neoasaia chiangmaiensis NBRC 101099]|nr:major facilitator superfamily transporter [Neoasaia chiangmaiensis NBRC 101099]
MLLLCLGLGSITTMPVAGVLAGRFGCRWIIAVAVAVVACALPVLAFSGAPIVIAVALALFGAGIGSIDCAINLQAIIVERACGRAMMSGFHGLFSVGGLLGATGASGLLGLGLSPLSTAFILTGLIVVAGIAAVPGLLSGPLGAGEGPVFALPRGVVLALGAMCFIVFLAEGAAIDWSAVFLTTVRHVAVRYGGLGYVAFACTMTAGRLYGDRLVGRFRGRTLVVAGGLLAAAGMLLVATVPLWPLTLAGYAMVGAGCANIVPVLYSAVGRQRRMPEHLAVSAITTLGYAGILIGPAALGFVANAASLALALAAVGVMLVGVAVMGMLLRRSLLEGR